MKSSFRFVRFLELIRAVFPKWNFFDRVACQYELEFEGAKMTDWRRVDFSAPLRPWSFLVDPVASEILLQRGIVERFAREIQELALRPGGAPVDAAFELVSGAMLRDLVELKAREGGVPGPLLRFRILAVEPHERVEYYVSPWLKVGS